MWLIILSDQLDVFALVGHYPTNKLMSRGPLLWRQLESEASFPARSTQNRATYAVLATLSSGCPPLEGRLSTCYSPVRRSTRDPKVTFALDLHVLGLPLTFALSQDQTLHLNGSFDRFFPSVTASAPADAASRSCATRRSLSPATGLPFG